MFDLIAVDDLGEAVAQVDIEPRVAHVTIPVFSDRETRTLPVDPVVTGDPAAGFEIAGVTVDPLVDPRRRRRRPAGRARPHRHRPDPDDRGLVGPDRAGGARPADRGRCRSVEDQVSVTITLRPVTATRTFSAGLRSDRRRTGLDLPRSTPTASW